MPKTAYKTLIKPRTFAVPAKPHHEFENELAQHQYNDKAKVIAALAKKGITTEFAKLATATRNSFGVVVYTSSGYTSQPNAREAAVEMRKRIRVCRSITRNVLGLVHACKRNLKQFRNELPKQEWVNLRKHLRATEDLDAFITKLFAKHKLSS